MMVNNTVNCVVVADRADRDIVEMAKEMARNGDEGLWFLVKRMRSPKRGLEIWLASDI